jgi:ubiquinone biosynthesis protein
MNEAAKEPQPSLMGVAVRDLGRLKRVSTIIARHGFGELLMRTGLGKRLYAGEHVPDGDSTITREPPAVRLTKLLAALGPTYIKLGQILSMRKDLFSPEAIAALEKLQDDAPALPFSDIKAQVEKGLGAPIEELYAEFSTEPLATASIAQTHLAKTHAGEQVVVKVQRPGIDQVMRSDLDLLYLGAQMLEASIDEMQLLGVSRIVEEFERGLLRELNFQKELGSLLAFRQNLDPTRKVMVPRPHPELSSKTVLTMDFFRGKPLRALTPNTPEAKSAVEEVVHAACKQVFIDGLFHGDPHSGNILINDQGILCMLDLGMVGTLTPEQRDDVVSLIIATITGDSGSIARILLRMGTPTERVSIGDLKREIERIRGQYLVVGSLGDYDSAGFAEEFAKAAGKFRIKLAPEYAILIKAAATIEGIVRHLYPKVDLVGIAQPYAKQILAQRYDPQRIARELLGEATGLGAALRTLPDQLDQVLHDFDTGNVQIRAVTPELDLLPATLHQVGSRIVLGMFAVSMTLATAVVLPTDTAQTLRVVLAVCCGLLATGAWTILFWWHFVGRGKPVRLTPLIRFFRR